MSSQDVVFTLGADGSAFAAGLKKMAGQASGALKEIGSMFFGVQGIAAGLNAVFGGISGKAAEVENVAASLGVLLRNDAEAQSLTASLQRLATNGVIGFNELHRAARPLANVFSGGQDIAKYVGIFADIAAGSKVPIDTMARMVSRIGDMGKAEFTELANNGVPVFEMLSRVTGKSAAELVKMSAEGKITKEQLLQAFELMTQKGERFYQMNATLSNTTAGSWATLKASVDECLAEFGKPINDAIRPLLQDLSTWLQENKSELTAAAGTLMQVLQTAGSAVTAVLSPLQKLYELSSSSLGSLGGALVTLSAAMAGYAVMTGRVWTSMHIGPITYRRVVEGSLAGIKRAGAAACAGLRTAFSFTWGALTAVARVACTAIKAALISTGVGALVWLLGEGAAAVWQLFQNSDDERSQEAEARRAVTVDMQLQSAMQRIAADEAQRKAEAENAAASALARQNEEIKKAKQAMSEAYFASRDKQAQEWLRSLSPESRRRVMLGNAGVKDEADIEQKIQALRRMDSPLQEHVDRLRELLSLQSELLKMQRDAEKNAATAAKKEAEERQKALADYHARRDAEREAAWEKNTTLAEKREWYFGSGSVQLTPGAVSAAQVRADMEALANEDPVKHASMIADMEKWLSKVQALEDAEAAEAARRREAPNSARVSVVQASLASVGGGGASIRIGDKQFREAQHQTKLLSATIAAVNNGGYDLCVSLHCDSAAGNTSAHGAHVCYYSLKGYTCAIEVADRLCLLMPGRAAKVVRRKLDVLRKTNCTAILIELGFTTNRADADKLTDPAHLSRVVDAISEGIEFYCTHVASV